MNKSTIRKIYQQKRYEITEYQIKSHSQKIADNFIQNLLPEIINFASKKLSFYISANNEADPIFIMQHCQNLGNFISLPKIVPSLLFLEFRSYKIGDDLYRNALYPEILEPAKSSPKIIPDIIFVPLVAFDKNCNRIGMGGGFYDATIRNIRKNNNHTIFIGLGYDCQEHNFINTQNNDEILDFIISQNNIFSRNQ